jgi:hypothetical protein
MQSTSAALMIVRHVGVAIRDLGSVPSGHLYAQLMGILTLDQYNAIINTLKKAGMVSESGNLLTWIGPKE